MLESACSSSPESTVSLAWAEGPTTKESMVMSLSKMASKSGETPQVHYFLGTCDPHCLPSSFLECESYQDDTFLASNFCRSCLCSNFCHWGWGLHKNQATHPHYYGDGCHGTSEAALCPLLPWYCVKSSWNIWFWDYQHVFYLEKVFFHLGKVYFNLISPSI